MQVMQEMYVIQAMLVMKVMQVSPEREGVKKLVYFRSWIRGGGVWESQTSQNVTLLHPWGQGVKDEEANQTLFFKRLENNFAHKRPFHGPSIFPGTKENLLNFSFYKNIPNYIWYPPPSPAYLRCFWFRRAVVASIQLVPKYIVKVKVVSKFALK